MAYVLEKISSADQEKILVDATCDQRKLNALISRQYFKYNPDLNWAVDREHGNYMFFAPRTREQSSGPHFYFYFKGGLYAFHLHGNFEGNSVIFDEKMFPPDFPLHEFQDEITEAFTVYGRAGTGNHGGDWMYVVTPEFKGGDE